MEDVMSFVYLQGWRESNILWVTHGTTRILFVGGS